jgi:hypothetical protein
MLGKRPNNYTLFDVGNVWDLEMDRKSFYYQLAVATKNGLFKDDDFAGLYHDWRGRPSVAPSQLAAMLVLQTHDGVSDEQAVSESAFDLRWAAVLGRHCGEPLCAKSTLQLFRSHLILHKEFSTILARSIKAAKDAGLIKGRAVTAALDTKPMLGRGAVQDTYNLLAQGMRQLARALAKDAKKPASDFMEEKGLGVLNAPSIKGTTVVDWNDRKARDSFLGDLVEKARGLLSMASSGSDNVRANAELLSQLLLQDIEEKPAPVAATNAAPPAAGHGAGDVAIRQETVPDRAPSATDPEQRHGRKSASKRFNGHKSSIVADTSSGIILSCEILAGNAGDAEGALEQVAEAEKNAGVRIVQTLGDCAYGGSETRAAFGDAKRSLFAKVPALASGPFSKGAFQIDVINADVTLVTCPAGHTSDMLDESRDGRRTYFFDAFCRGCELRAQCTTSKFGRSISVHPNEGELQKARQFQNTTDGRDVLKQRLAVENALGRLSRYGIGQARYIGRAKSKFQLTIACTVANLRRAWNYAQNADIAGDPGVAATAGAA